MSANLAEKNNKESFLIQGWSMRYLICFCLLVNIAYAQTLPLNKLKMPPGFTIEVYAKILHARQMALGSNGTIFVGTNDENVYAVTKDKNNRIKVQIIASGLSLPTGVEFHQGALYVAAVDRILRYDNIEHFLNKPPAPVSITNSLPDDSHHGWRFIRFGPDDKLYIAIGLPCNICIKQDPRFGTISRMNKDGSQFEIYAKGIRNSVGFDWDPVTNYLWFTDNGRDWLGDDLPPDEINVAARANLNFGFPYCYGMNKPDHVYNKNCQSFIPAAYELPAHVAALGMRFYTGKQFPSDYQNQIVIAEHGSWNRSQKTGYQVVLAALTKDRKQITSVKPFITGWLDHGTVWGRPVDVLVMKDGSLLISDDFAGVIYRVYYKANQKFSS